MKKMNNFKKFKIGLGEKVIKDLEYLHILFYY